MGVTPDSIKHPGSGPPWTEVAPAGAVQHISPASDTWRMRVRGKQILFQQDCKLGNRAAEQGVRERVCGSGSDGGKRGAKRIRGHRRWVAGSGGQERKGWGRGDRKDRRHRGEKELAQWMSVSCLFIKLAKRFKNKKYIRHLCRLFTFCHVDQQWSIWFFLINTCKKSNLDG